MRCDCCDTVLTDYEASIKSVKSGDYLNTCKKCLKGLSIDYKGNRNLQNRREILDEEDDIDDVDILKFTNPEYSDLDEGE